MITLHQFLLKISASNYCKQSTVKLFTCVNFSVMCWSQNEYSWNIEWFIHVSSTMAVASYRSRHFIHSGDESVHLLDQERCKDNENITHYWRCHFWSLPQQETLSEVDTRDLQRCWWFKVKTINEIYPNQFRSFRGNINYILQVLKKPL